MHTSSPGKWSLFHTFFAHFVAKKIELVRPCYQKSPTDNMSYTIGTRLISGNRIEHATVLSNGMVMADAYENGWRWRSMMKLEDWLIISGDVKVMKDEPFVGVSVGFAPAPAPAPVEQEQEAAPPLPLPQRPVGTKLRWVLSEETYRIAIATANGILQVKCVADGEGCWSARENTNSWERPKLKKRMFPTEEEWRASLPQGGQVTIVELAPKNVPLVVEGASDVEKVEQLADRFKVRAGVNEDSPPFVEREGLMETVRAYTRIIASLDAQAALSDAQVKACESYKRSLGLYKARVQKIDEMSEAEKSCQEFSISRWAQSRQKLMVTLANGISTQISPSSKINRAYKGGQPIVRGIFCHHDRKLYSSLNEMNVFKQNGRPVIHAHYRTRVIDLSHLFAN